MLVPTPIGYGVVTKPSATHSAAFLRLHLALSSRLYELHRPCWQPAVPYVYIPKGLDKATFAATGTFFFGIVNLTKMPAYYLAGQMDWDIILQALVLAPFAPIGVYLGLWLNNRLNHDKFFKVIFAFVFVIGVKLIWESV